jgi:serine/threonine-protein kinase RsbW
MLTGGVDDGCWQQASVHTTADMATVLDAVALAMQAEGYSERDCFGMRLALEEALLNAVKHGHRGDPSKEVRVRYHISSGQALAEVEDEGAGFDPARVPDPLAPENLEKPSGRGLLLMRSYLTWLRHNARGNHLTLCKCRSA